jgi:hypothetical protein
MKIKITVAFICLLCSFFASCYEVNDRNYLNITFNGQNLSSVFFKKYVDVVRNKNLVITDDVKNVFLNGETLNDDERIIYFKNNPEEWYMVSFDASPFWIKYIYSPKISNVLIYQNKQMENSEFVRIKTRIENELIKPAIQYGKENKIADSIIFSKIRGIYH